MSANKNNASAIREMTPEELSKTLRSDREELLNLRLRKNTGQVDNPARIRTLRREIARLETVAREKRAAR
ncbi:MAG: 50S ribosomal protein L29 [Opitutales bacterium]|nr:50S ribosomal protein L29 [Opitutales bacterium]MBQ7332353.1 50S ribosomal protein L29 [Opitutales bacterium]MBQ9758377.1 50S ribosomal protein L29 [Opitutales bacterium]